MRNEQAWYVDSSEVKEMLFPQAAEVWLATRAPYIWRKNVSPSPRSLLPRFIRVVGADDDV